MRTLLTLVVAGLLACGFVGYASADEGLKAGMGVELSNQPTTALMSVVTYDDDVVCPGLYLTPSILFTIRVIPGVFIEPSLGFHRFSRTEEYTGTSTLATKKQEWSAHDLSLGLGMIYALTPDATVSPMLHPMFGLHLLKGVSDVTPGSTSGDKPYKYESSATAFSLGLGIGGLVNLKETVYMTAEARLMWTMVGDVEKTREPASTTPEDEYDTSSSVFDTDMVIGIRFVF